MEIRWTEEASNSLESIYKYIASDNELKAVETVTGIFEKARVLK